MTVAAPTPERLTLTYRDAARLLGLSERSCWTLVATGQLRAARIGRRVLIPRAELDRFLAAKLGNHQPASA